MSSCLAYTLECYHLISKLRNPNDPICFDILEFDTPFALASHSMSLPFTVFHLWFMHLPVPIIAAHLLSYPVS